MDHFAGLGVSVKETSVCIVDDTGKIVREVKVASEPEALLAVLKNPAYHFKRIGLEAGPLSQWLFSALAEAELPVVCVETRHMQAVLKAQINKTDRNDARGIAQGRTKEIRAVRRCAESDPSVSAAPRRTAAAVLCPAPPQGVPYGQGRTRGSNTLSRRTAAAVAIPAASRRRSAASSLAAGIPLD